MIRTGTVEVAVQTAHREVSNPQFTGTIDYLITSDGSEAPVAPQGFLVKQVPNWTLPVHFHRERQFQVVVGGGGTLGKHALAPVSVHYTSKESGYGPIVSGGEGIWYFTLRAKTDPGGAWYLPGAKDKMTPGLRKWQATSDPIGTSSPAELRAVTQSSTRALIEPLPDGAAAWVMRVPPGASAQAPEGKPGAPRFHVVVSGSMRLGEETLPRLALAFSSDEDSRLGVTAGEDGLELLVLEYPLQ